MGNCFNKKHKAIKAGASESQIIEFIKNVKPLDLLVFKGAEGISNIITGLQHIQTGRGDISHVEVAITREWCSKIKIIAAETHIDDTDQTLFSWGSTQSGKLNDGVDNAETGGATFGVQVRVLEDIVRQYLKTPGANIGVCKLIDNPINRRDCETDVEYELRTELLKYQIDAAYDRYNGAKYDANLFSLLGALFPKLRGIRKMSEDVLGKFTDVNSWLFCSEWCAVLYISIGVINDATDGVIDGKILDPKDVTPVDFLGVDIDGIVSPICSEPLWIKK